MRLSMPLTTIVWSAVEFRKAWGFEDVMLFSVAVSYCLWTTLLHVAVVSFPYLSGCNLYPDFIVVNYLVLDVQQFSI